MEDYVCKNKDGLNLYGQIAIETTKKALDALKKEKEATISEETQRLLRLAQDLLNGYLIF